MTDQLTLLLEKLDEPAARYYQLDQYYNGDSPLSFLAPEVAASLGGRLRKVSVNIPRLLVDSIAERLRVTSFAGVDVWGDWLRNDLDQTSHIAHREALVLGNSYAIVWADQYGRPRVTIESAKQVAALCDPGTRTITAAIKRWEDDKRTYAIVYGPNEIVRYEANHTGATTAGFKVVESIANPLGIPPVVRFTNTARLLDEGRSEMTDVLDLSDALVKLTTDMLVASEYGARPRRWATGVELTEEPELDDDGNETGDMVTTNPFPETDRMLISEAADAKFGQLAGSDLGGYEAATGIIMRQISAVSGLPEHMLGIGGDNPTSADSIRASEAALTARAEARQAQFGRSWEQVARLMTAVTTGADPQQVDCRVQWADPSTRSEAQLADATVKLFQAGIIPASTALARLGYSADEITEIRAARRGEALDAQAVDLTKLVS
ncbi:phage portal protein [Skermania sp. ID1734]|uniref:phage portal protein n=1 Tax=Skermania sp. ID1734 TaxID=2597516 RepID=UPI001180A72D|nr:phage portal protein [Skermania sp. ID1734]TSE00664.1 phage portal protein [Skermania sp. ID1734]